MANDCSPLKLKTIRQHMIDRDLCRTEVNKRVGRIKRVFKWKVSGITRTGIFSDAPL